MNNNLQNLDAAAQLEMANKIIEEVDNHDEGLPNLPLNLNNFFVWSIEDAFLPEEIPGTANPGVIITFANPSDPRGTPVIFSRDRALKLASQIKKHAQTGPSMAQRAAQSGLAVPQSPAGSGLILPS